MLAKAKDAPLGEEPESPTSVATSTAPEAPSAEGDARLVDRAALEDFLAEVGPAIAELRAVLDRLRERTDALDAARRGRRERLAAGADEAADRLAKLRGE